MERRDFLKLSGLSSMALLSARPLMAALAPAARWDRTLVLVQLAGGNDGLNTVVPFADPAYARLRPTLALPRASVVPLSDTHGFHRALEPLMASWKAGDLAVVQGVGYPNPNRSHFRSIEIWETASSSDQYLQDGWLDRVFAASPPPAAYAADAVVLGGASLGPLAGTHGRTLSMADPDRFADEMRVDERPPASAASGGHADAPPVSPALARVLRVQADMAHAAGSLDTLLAHAPSVATAFPRTGIGRDLEGAARLMAAGIRVPVIKVAIGSFDTHANQANVQGRLLGQLADALAAFRTAMKAAGAWDRILVMTYSEFGRRVAENGSAGTDHGTAAPHFLMGGRVHGGFHGAAPSLTETSSGDLVHAVDFRALDSTVVRRHFELPPGLLPELDAFRPLDLLA